MHETNIEAARTITMNLFDAFPFKEDKEMKGSCMCSHPFTTSLFIPDRSNHRIIDLRNKEDADGYRAWIDEIVGRSNIVRLYMLIQGPYKMTWFRFVSPYLSDEDYGTMLKECWIKEDNPNQDENVPIKMAIELFRRAKKDCIMDKEEQEYYDNLPGTLTLYRGVSEGRERLGLSWTDNYDVAVWYQKRFEEWGRDGIVLKAEVKKENVLAYFEHDNEIIVDTKYLKDVTEI